MSTTTRPRRRLLGGALAAAVAATTVSLAPTPATAASNSSEVFASSLDDVVTLKTVVTTSATNLLGTSTEYAFASAQGTWRFDDPRTSLGSLALPLDFDADEPSKVFGDVETPQGLSERLPDGSYAVTAVTTLKLLFLEIPVISEAATVVLDRFTVPSQPEVSLGGVGERLVSWAGASDDGGTAVTGYVVRLYGADGQIGDDLPVGPEVREFLLDALPAEVTYVAVAARNAVGEGLPGSARPLGAPVPSLAGAPTAVSATPGDQRATVSWSAPTTGVTPAAYVVTATPGGATCSTSATTCDVTGLDNGRPYTFTVASFLPAGLTSEPSAPVTPSTVPGATGPVSAVSVRHDGATLRWTAPQSTGGSAITGYDVSIAGRTLSTTATELAVDGLAASTSYTASVVARNANGAGATPMTTTFTTTARPVVVQPRLTATVAPKAKRSGKRAALVRVDLSRSATVTVRVVRKKLVATRTVNLTGAPTWVSVPVRTKARKLLDGRRVTLQVRSVSPAKTLASRAGTVRR